MVLLLILAALLCAAPPAAAVTVRTADWAVHFNLPDQDNSFATSGDPNEWAIRDALLARIDALAAGQEAFLAIYTFSGSNTCCGAAGPVLNAVNAALDRGASVHMAVDGGVSLTTQYGNFTLAGLTNRPVNKLDLERDDSTDGIMHDKLGLFDYGPGNRWVFVASWNFSSAASSFQWNIALEARSDTLYAAYKSELFELLAGRFHDHANKSHAHDNAVFTLSGAWDVGRARFAPYPDANAGGNNALTDVTNAIALAKAEIAFAINHITRFTVRDQLIAAANRGVRVTGVMPKSTTNAGGESADIYAALINPANYTTTNVVKMLTAYAKADGSALDTGQSDLVHAKFMVIDPYGEEPLLIHGSANWSGNGLASTNRNDENILFLPHREVARLFYADFKRITGAFGQRSDFWLDTPVTNGFVTQLWATDTNALIVQTAPAVAGPWSTLQTNKPGVVGFTTFTNSTGASAGYLRAVRP